MRRFLAALLIASIASAAQAAPVVLSGRVGDAQGAPVAGAEVTAYFEFNVPEPHRMRLQQAARAVAGADGRFSVELTLPRDCFQAVLIARKEGLAPSWAEYRLNPWRAHEVKDINIALEPSAHIAGTVCDAAGKPVAGAEVTADVYLTPENGTIERRIAGGPPLDWLRTETDAQGGFTIKDLPKTASVDLHVTAAGKGGLYLEKAGESVGQFDAGDSNIRVTLQPEARIQGTVVDEDTRKPLAGVSVLILPNPEPAETDAQVRVTGPDGQFEASGLVAGDYTVSLARLPRQLPAALAKPVAVKDVRTGEVRKEVVLPASAGGRLEVLVSNEKKEPVSGASVMLQGRSDDSEQRRYGESAFSGDDGVAAFRLQPGTYQVGQISSELYSLPDIGDELDVEKDKTLRVAITVAENPHAAGVVLDPQGKSVAGASVELFMLGGIGPGKTDKDGKFKISWPLNPGSALNLEPLLIVRAPATNLAAFFPIEDAEKPDDLKITLTTGITITGAVMDPDNKPIPAATVQVMLTHGSYGAPLPEENKTGPDGKYTIRALPDGGNYQMIARATGYGELMQIPVDLTAAKDGIVEMEPLTLKRANLTVTGIVMDADDKPVSGAHISVWGGEQNVQQIQSGKDGKFTLKNLCDADAMIRAWKEVDGEQQQGSVNFTSDMKEVKIVLGENARGQFNGNGPQPQNLRASGVVVDAQGRPIAGASVEVIPFNRQLRKTDKDGKFKVAWQRWPGQQNISNSLLVRAPKENLAVFFSLDEEDKLDDLKIALAPGIIVTGTVVDPDNKPIPRARIEFTLLKNNYNSQLQDQIRIGPDGKYAIRALPADENFRLTASAKGFGRNQSPVDLTAARDRHVEMEPITLKRANLTITGIVVDEDDNPVSGAQINAWGGEQNIQNAVSNKEGKFTLKNVCDAEATIQAQKQAGGAWLNGSVNYSPDMKEVRIVMGLNGRQGMVIRPPPTAEELFADGQKAMDEEQWAEAVAKFKRLAEKYPKDARTPEALTAAIAICENRLNDQKTADELRKKAEAVKLKIKD